MPGLAYFEAVEKYNLMALKWLGRPAASPLVERDFDATDLESLSATSSGPSRRAWQLQRKRSFQEALEAELEPAREAKRATKTTKKHAAMEKRKAKREAKKLKEAATFAAACAKWERKFETLDGWKNKQPALLKHSQDSLLPLDVWCRILTSFCGEIEPEGVRGPSVIARELSELATVNKELYAACLLAFQNLSELCQPVEESVSMIKEPTRLKRTDQPLAAVEEAIWNRLISDPTALASSDLKQLAKALGLTCTRPKPVLIVNLMEHLRLKHPTPLPARLVLAVREEKVLKSHDQLELLRLSAACGILNSNWWGFSKFETRQACLQQGITSFSSLEAKAEARKCYY